MKNQERVEDSQTIVHDQPQNAVQAQPQNTKITVQVERFPFAKAKFSKEAWDSGEGGGEDTAGEHDGER